MERYEQVDDVGEEGFDDNSGRPIPLRFVVLPADVQECIANFLEFSDDFERYEIQGARYASTESGPALVVEAVVWVEDGMEAAEWSRLSSAVSESLEIRVDGPLGLSPEALFEEAERKRNAKSVARSFLNP